MKLGKSELTREENGRTNIHVCKLIIVGLTLDYLT